MNEDIYEAAKNGDVQSLRRYIQRGVDVNQRDRFGDTPLHHAALVGQTETVEILIQHGANINARNNIGNTPLHNAALRGQTETVKILIKRGANINAKNVSGDTPLHRAAWRGQTETVEILIQRGANINAQNKGGDTPLHRTTWRGHTETVEILIQHGANINAQNKLGQTTLHRAARERCTMAVKTLLQAGANLRIQDKEGNTAGQIAGGKIREILEELEKTGIPKEIRVIGQKAIGKYLDALFEDSAVSNVIRVMLVGHFGVGKTTIAMYLLEKKVRRIESTDGIDVYINQCLYNKKSRTWQTTKQYHQTLLGIEDLIRLDLVDFAGQLIFYTTHQTYLTSRGLYLLVFNLAKGLDGEVEDEDLHPSKIQKRHVIDFLEFWISTIVTYARSDQDNYPKIVLIGTHKDRVQASDLIAIKERILEKFDTMVRSEQLIVREDLFISAKHMSGETRGKIREVILEEGMKYQEFGERVPSKWSALQEELLKLKTRRQYVVSMEDVRKINRTLRNPLEEEELGIFLKYLHNIGYILYFNTAILKEKIILDPKFVIDAMKCFITCERFIQRFLLGKVWKQMRESGKVKKSHILKTWTRRELSEHSEHLLAIMRKLDLLCEPMIYRFGEKIPSEFFVVPCMINAAKPGTSVVPALQEAQLVQKVGFSSEAILPPAIFNRLVCSCLALWEIFEGHFYNGLVVIRSGRYHLIEISRQVNQITITFAHKEPGKGPDTQLCKAIKEFLKETIDRTVALYSTSFDKPISYQPCGVDAVVDESHNESQGRVNRQTTKCRCEAYLNRQLEDVNLMRIGKHLQEFDLGVICTTLLNNERYSMQIQQKHSRFWGDVKMFYILQRWKQQTKEYSAAELKRLLEDHLEENRDKHIICQAMRDEELMAESFDSTILVSKVYPEFLSAIADNITYEYMHLGLELGLTLPEIERLQMDKDNVTLEITRAMLEKWYDTQREEATVFRLVKAFHRCGVTQLEWMEKEFDVLKIKDREANSVTTSARSECSVM